VKINNKFYDILKYIALIALPALGTFWTIVGAVWGAPHTDEVVKTIVAVGTLLGALLILSTSQYNNSDRRFDGTLNVAVTPPDQDDVVTGFDVPDLTPNQITDKGELTLKVKQHHPEG
jgi:hypothetical protein